MCSSDLSIDSFEYDGYGTFNADITSDQTGSGVLSVSFNEKVFSNIIAGDRKSVV